MYMSNHRAKANLSRNLRLSNGLQSWHNGSRGASDENLTSSAVAVRLLLRQVAYEDKW
jgi:hypothetical protein